MSQIGVIERATRAREKGRHWWCQSSSFSYSQAIRLWPLGADSSFDDNRVAQPNVRSGVGVFGYLVDWARESPLDGNSGAVGKACRSFRLRSIAESRSVVSSEVGTLLSGRSAVRRSEFCIVYRHRLLDIAPVSFRPSLRLEEQPEHCHSLRFRCFLVPIRKRQITYIEERRPQPQRRCTKRRLHLPSLPALRRLAS